MTDAKPLTFDKIVIEAQNLAYYRRMHADLESASCMFVSVKNARNDLLYNKIKEFEQKLQAWQQCYDVVAKTELQDLRSLHTM